MRETFFRVGKAFETCEDSELLEATTSQVPFASFLAEQWKFERIPQARRTQRQTDMWSHKLDM